MHYSLLARVNPVRLEALEGTLIRNGDAIFAKERYLSGCLTLSSSNSYRLKYILYYIPSHMTCFPFACVIIKASLLVLFFSFLSYVCITLVLGHTFEVDFQA